MGKKLNRKLRDSRQKVRAWFRKVNWGCRLVTARYRALPDFIIIGAMKSGTTSLLNYLGQHPRITPSWIKEVHYFDRKHEKGSDWYRANFALAVRRVPTQLVGEATPSYLFNPEVPARIRNLLPNVKLIAILRDPAERAISHYYHEVARGRETLTLDAALDAENDRIGNSVLAGKYTDSAYVHFSYKSRGRYCEQLERYRALFPRENLLLLDFEELKRQPTDTVRKVLKFLGIDDEFRLSDPTPRNVGVARAPIPTTTRKALESYFEPYNDKLFESFSFNPSWNMRNNLADMSATAALGDTSK